MTRAFPVAVAVLSWLGSPSLAAFREPPCARAKAALAVREEKAGGAAALAARLLETSSDTDVQHYRLSLEIDPTTRYLTGSDIMTVRSQVAGLERFRFRLWVLLTIDAVLVDGRAATWQRLDDATVEVSLGRSYGVGEEFQLQVDYSGYAGGGILLDTHANTAVLSSLSEPWNAFTWWPAKDDNTDKATADLFLTAPAGMSAVSNGVLVGSEPVSGGRTRFHWHTDYLTAVYLISMSITNYQTATAFFTFGDLSMPVTLYLYPESNTPENRTAWFRAVDMLGTFSHLFGPYPFAAEKYGICEFPFSGGMEHQTITGQGGGSRFSEFLTAHELAHQWWGDLVTCATWHDIWLNEGFATYAEALWEEFKPGSPGLPALLSVMASLRPGNVNGTVYVSDDSDVRRIFSSTFSYQKGGWVLHMLRHVVGDEEFFATLATWRQAYGGGAATTEQFRAVAEQVHKADLSWFFNEWVYRPGAPQYAWGWRERQGADQRYAEVYLEQRQSASYPTFAMPLDVRVRTTAGDETRVGWSDARAEHLLVPVKAPVVGVDLDPDGWVLTEGVTTTPFVEGPPKIVTTWPPPGAAVIPEGVAVLRVGFQVDVQATGPDFTLTGPTGATVPLAFEYDAGSYTAVLRPAQLLGAGAYTLIVSDSITSRASGLRLDGELPAGALPSGDGLPGGATELHFFVVPAHHPRLRLVRAHDTPPT